MTLDFGRICLANFLFFVSFYILLPLMPLALPVKLGIGLHQMGGVFLIFISALYVVGPLQAYLYDTYKRKHVLVLSILSMLGVA